MDGKMVRFILATFAILGWAFYELSGGADFEPTAAALTNVREDPLKSGQSAAEGAASDVTRVALDLVSVEDVLTDTRRIPQRIETTAERITSEQGGLAQRIPARSREGNVAPQSTRTDDALQTEPGETVLLPSLVQDARVQSSGDDAFAVNASTGSPDIRAVTGNRVNVRGGPGTAYPVISGVVEGDLIEVIQENGDGWVQMRPVDGGPVGWIADFLLSES
jgi:hypothetical protein